MVGWTNQNSFVLCSKQTFSNWRSNFFLQTMHRLWICDVCVIVIKLCIVLYMYLPLQFLRDWNCSENWSSLFCFQTSSRIYCSSNLCSYSVINVKIIRLNHLFYTFKTCYRCRSDIDDICVINKYHRHLVNFWIRMDRKRRKSLCFLYCLF